LLSVELCTLTLQKTDLSIPAIISAALFGDGAAAIVGVGRDLVAKSDQTALPRIRATRSIFYPDTERVMGWDVGADGFKVVLSADVAQIVEGHLRADVDGFLSEFGLGVSDISSWICHPGGPRVIGALRSALGLSDDDLVCTWKSLRSTGNLSSASVLFVLDETLRSHRRPAGSPGIMIAMGPGFCSELVLFEW